jgi:sugar O-acyltransferase (sialic acid O-acetyltransferase NeuD family)
MSDEIYIVGAGGHAKVVSAAIEAGGRRVIALLDENASAAGFLMSKEVRPLPAATWWGQEPRSAHLAIGRNSVRQRLSSDLNAKWVSVVHPTAWVHESARIGRGVFIGAGVVVQPDAFIGDHTIVNTGVIVEHDCVVGRFCHLAPRTILAGGVKVGDGAFLGAGTTVIPEVHIGEWTILGAGAVVIRNVEREATLAGVPARVLGSSSREKE